MPTAFRPSAVLLAVAAFSVAAARAEPAGDCEARMPEMVALTDEIAALESAGLELFDSLVSGRDDPARLARGCAVFASLLPLYARLAPYAERCWVGNPDVQAEGLAASIERGRARARTYLATARCR